MYNYENNMNSGCQMQQDVPLNSIRLDDVEEYGGKFTPLPAGTYDVVISQSREGETKKGAKYLQITFKVTTGLQTGDTTSTFLYIYGGNPNGVATGKSILKRIRTICGLQTQTAGEPEELVGHQLRIKTSVKPNWQGEPQSYVDFYYPPAPAAAPQQSGYRAYEPPLNGRLW